MPGGEGRAGWTPTLARSALGILPEHAATPGRGPMARSDLEQLRDQVKALSEADRAELAHDLLATLDGAPDADATQAWEQELMVRLADVQQGTATTLGRVELSERLQRCFR
ncbi:MAG: addiction module protein [Pseudomonadota bacterium]